MTYRDVTLVKAVQMAIVGVGVFAILYGVNMIIGGDGRMQAPAFATIRAAAALLDLSPALLWGASMAAFGALVVLPRTEVAGLFLASCWCFLFAVGAFDAATRDAVASVTGWPIYGFVGVIIAGLVAVRRAGLVPRRSL